MIPNQAAEHYYLITDTIDGIDPNAPIFEDPSSYGYYREEGGGMMVGLFEPQGGPVAGGGHPAGLLLRSHPAGLGPDGAVPGEGDGAGADHHGGGGPHLLLRTRVVHPRPRPGGRRGARDPGLLRRRGNELRRRALRRGAGQGDGALDHHRASRCRRDRVRRGPVPAVAGRRRLPSRADRRDPRHRLRRPHPRQAAAHRPQHLAVARARPAGGAGWLPAGGVRLGGRGLVRRAWTSPPRPSRHGGGPRGSPSGRPSTVRSARASASWT